MQIEAVGILATGIGTLAGVVGVMWKKLSKDHERLAKRSDKCEEDRAMMHMEIAQVKADLSVFKACPSSPCPAREGLDRAGSFKVNRKPQPRPEQ